jgi:hypothetical protein
MNVIRLALLLRAVGLLQPVREARHGTNDQTDCCGADSSWHPLTWPVGSTELSLSLVPHVCPRIATGRLRRSNVHVNHAMPPRRQIVAMPSQREGQGSASLSSTPFVPGLTKGRC